MALNPFKPVSILLAGFFVGVVLSLATYTIYFTTLATIRFLRRLTNKRQKL
jgi:hypothetical protein